MEKRFYRIFIPVYGLVYFLYREMTFTDKYLSSLFVIYQILSLLSLFIGSSYLIYNLL